MPTLLVRVFANANFTCACLLSFNTPLIYVFCIFISRVIQYLLFTVRRSEDWVETTYGEGPGCFICHVQIPSSWNHVLPEQTNEMKEGMDWVWYVCCLEGYTSVLLLSYSISSGALGSLGLLPSCSITTISLHITTILIITISTPNLTDTGTRRLICPLD